MRHSSWIAIIVAIVFAACKSDTPTQPPVGAGAIPAPKNISVRTIDTNTIGVEWSRTASDTRTDSVIVTMQGGALAAKVPVASPDSSTQIAGLHPGITYWIQVRSADSTASPIPWSIQTSPSNIPAPTHISVRTIDTNTIVVFWSRAMLDNQADTVIVTTLGGTIAGKVRAPAPDSLAPVVGLHPGIVYSVLVRSADAAAPLVPWSLGPAPGPIPAPTSVTVVTVDTNTIGITWTRAASDTKDDRVTVTTQGGALAGEVRFSNSSAMVIGLHPSVAYSIVVSSADNAALPVPWMIQPLIGKVATHLMANSSGNGGVGLRWTRDPSDNGVDTVFVFDGFYYIWDRIPVPAPASSVVINSKATIYEMCVHSSGGTSETLHWAPAQRFGSEANPIRVWEVTAESQSNGQPTGHYDGLCVSCGQTVQPNGSYPNPEHLLDLQLILDDVQSDPMVFSSSGLSLVSPHLITASSNHTYFDSVTYYSPGGLDSFYTSNDLTFPQKSSIGRAQYEYGIPGDASPNRGSAILVLQVPDPVPLRSDLYYYAKVEVVQQPDGRLFGGTAPNRYVDVVISVSSTGTWPWAFDSSHLPDQYLDYAEDADFLE